MGRTISKFTLVAREECDCPGNCGGKRWTATCNDCGAEERIGLSVEQDARDLAGGWMRRHVIVSVAHRR